MNIKPCPLCGSPPKEYWGAASEIYGTCWQTGSLDCSNKECYHGVTVEIDSDLTCNASELLEELWNLMAEDRFNRTMRKS